VTFYPLSRGFGPTGPAGTLPPLTDGCFKMAHLGALQFRQGVHWLRSVKVVLSVQNWR